jgi:membrane protein DedA with SNARE-associated domain
MQIQPLLNNYGFLLLFLIFIMEGAMLLYIAPSEGLVPAAIAVFGSELHIIVTIIFTAVIGATIGQYGLFYLSKNKGREYLLNHKWLKINEKHLNKSEGIFHKYGNGMVCFSNSFLFTRGMLTVPAGVSTMGDKKFILYSAIGTLLFETGLALLTLKIIELKAVI